jgi:hypothetical protein
MAGLAAGFTVHPPALGESVTVRLEIVRAMRPTT